jgi:hypothetical protein
MPGGKEEEAQLARDTEALAVRLADAFGDHRLLQTCSVYFNIHLSQSTMKPLQILCVLSTQTFRVI